MKQSKDRSKFLRFAPQWQANWSSCRGQVEGFGDPGAEVELHLVELGGGAGGDALEEVLGARDDDGADGRRGLLEDFGEEGGRAELVLLSGKEELRGGTVGEEVVAVVAAGGADGEAEADEAGDTFVAAAGAEAYVGAEGEAGKDDRELGVSGEVVEGGANVVDFAAAFVVDAF